MDQTEIRTVKIEMPLWLASEIQTILDCVAIGQVRSTPQEQRKLVKDLFRNARFESNAVC